MSYFNNLPIGGGGTGSGAVSSVNGRTGDVILNANDVGAIKNVLNSCSGIQIGTLIDRPSVADNNLLYIVTDKVPNEFFIYNATNSLWEQIGSSSSGSTNVVALDVKFTNTTTGLVSINVQDAIIELDKLIADHKAITDKNTSDITNLKSDVGNGKVKVNSTDTLDYLGTKVDGTSIQIVTDKLVAKTLEGLTASVTELDYTKGVKSNIQAQIDSLSSVGNFTGSVNTKADLVTLPTPMTSDLAIVISDETQGGASTIYMYDGTSWVFVGEFKVELRDFTTNPIDLTTEVKGVLPSINLDASVVLDSEIDVTLLNKFTEADNKLLYNGNPIGIVHGSVKQMFESNVIAPKTVKLSLPTMTDFSGIPMEVLSLMHGQKGAIETLSTFNSGDEIRYNTNNHVEFDLLLGLKKDYTFSTFPTLVQDVYELDLNILNDFVLINTIA